MVEKSPEAFKTISEAAEELGVEQHVLRFWETKFPQIKPLKRRGGRRYYRPEDMEVLHRIRHLLYKQGFTIKGARQAMHAKDTPAIATPDSATITVDSAPRPTTPALQGGQLDLLSPVGSKGRDNGKIRTALEAALARLKAARKNLQSVA